VRLEAEAKRDEFADKAAPFDQLLTVKSGLSNSRVYGPDAEGRFWRVDQANLSHRPSSQYSQFGYRSARLPGDASQQADIRLIRVEP
jgi:hypothetical protein